MNHRLRDSAYQYSLVLFFFLIYCTSCGHLTSRKKEYSHIPLHYTEKGIASWYGRDFHGRKTANGEIYDMYKYTAAHKYLPFGCHIQVTNLKNQLSTVVRVNDRGPFIKGRILDLSYNAARKLNMHKDGLAPIKLEVIRLPKHQKLDTFFIQVGAFVNYENARRTHHRLSSHYQTHLIRYGKDSNQPVYRVLVGPYALHLINQNLDELKTMGFVDSFITAQ